MRRIFLQTPKRVPLKGGGVASFGGLRIYQVPPWLAELADTWCAAGEAYDPEGAAVCPECGPLFPAAGEIIPPARLLARHDAQLHAPPTAAAGAEEPAPAPPAPLDPSDPKVAELLDRPVADLVATARTLGLADADVVATDEGGPTAEDWARHILHARGEI